MAGLGTRLFPATLACRKELFPVVGPDGVARPLLHFQLQSLVRAGFERIGLVVDPGGEEAIRHYFAGPTEERRARYAADPARAAELDEMAAIGARLQFIVQATPRGFGHALLCAREFVGRAPCLLCTGDLLYRDGCHEKLVTAFARAGGTRSVSGVARIGPDALRGYGTIAGRRRPEAPALIEITRILEKPTLSRARAELHVDGLPPNTWLGWFGLHLFTPAIFEVLETLDKGRGELDLTAAQDALRARQGYLALELPATDRFDFGLPGGLLDAMTAFARGAPDEAPSE